MSRLMDERLDADCERHCARELRSAEQLLWQHVLSYQPLVTRLIGRVEAELAKLPAAVAALRSAELWEGDQGIQRVEQAALALMGADRDRHAMAAVATDALAVSRSRQGQFRSYHAQLEKLWCQIAELRTLLFRSCRRVVLKIAYRSPDTLPFDDRVQEGNVGLMRGIHRFDPDRRIRLATYASWWIRQSMQAAAENMGRDVRLPSNVYQAARAHRAAAAALTTRLGRTATLEEVAEEMGTKPRTLDRMRTAMTSTAVSLHEPVQHDDGLLLVDVLPAPGLEGSADLADRLIDQLTAQRALALLDGLSPMEADILRRRFGIDDRDEQTLSEVGRDYSLTRERIRQIQQLALQKLRQRLEPAS